MSEKVSELPHKNLRWLVIGDSITASGLGVEKKYHDYVKGWLDCTVINVGAAGTGYINEFHGVKGWLDRVESFPCASEIDFITIMGALNDRHHAVGDYGSLIPHNLYGALRLFYDKMLDKYPLTPIGVITSTPRIYCWGESGEFIKHINAVVKMANEYSLPLLDLYRCSGLRPWIESNNKAYFDKADGVHPNILGHEIIAKKVYPFISNLLL